MSLLNFTSSMFTGDPLYFFAWWKVCSCCVHIYAALMPLLTLVRANSTTMTCLQCLPGHVPTYIHVDVRQLHHGGETSHLLCRHIACTSCTHTSFHKRFSIFVSVAYGFQEDAVVEVPWFCSQLLVIQF